MIKKLFINLMPISFFLKKLKNVDTNLVTILMYHEVLPKSSGVPAWTVVEEENFIQQMTFIKENFYITTLDELSNSNFNNESKPSVIVTFDDGYLGNYTSVLPIIEKLEIPCIFYIATQAFDENIVYWYDKVIYTILNKDNLIKKLDLTSFNLRVFKFSSHLNESLRWEEVQSLLTELKKMSIKERGEVVNFICSEAKMSLGPIMMNREQLSALSSSKFASIGSHTHCHSLLPQLTKEEIRASIKKNVDLIQKWCGVTPKHFAYPNGSYDKNSLEVVKEMQFLTATTVETKSVDKSSDLHLLPRLGVGRYDSIKFFIYRMCKIISK